MSLASLSPSASGRYTGRSCAKFTRRRVSTLVHFVKDHKTRTQQFRLTERLVDGLWGRASCLEDWRTFAALALPGEGCVADEGRFMGDERLILAHFMEASARLATDDLVASRYLEEASSAVDTLNTAVTTFVWRIPELLVANKSEAVAFPLCVQFCRHLFCGTSLCKLSGRATARMSTAS